MLKKEKNLRVKMISPRRPSRNYLCGSTMAAAPTLDKRNFDISKVYPFCLRRFLCGGMLKLYEITPADVAK